MTSISITKARAKLNQIVSEVNEIFSANHDYQQQRKKCGVDWRRGLESHSGNVVLE